MRPPEARPPPAVRAKGDQRGAIEAVRLALAAWDGEICRPDIVKDLAAAQQ